VFLCETVHERDGATVCVCVCVCCPHLPCACPGGSGELRHRHTGSPRSRGWRTGSGRPAPGPAGSRPPPGTPWTAPSLWRSARCPLPRCLQDPTGEIRHHRVVTVSQCLGVGESTVKEARVRRISCPPMGSEPTGMVGSKYAQGEGFVLFGARNWIWMRLLFGPQGKYCNYFI